MDADKDPIKLFTLIFTVRSAFVHDNTKPATVNFLPSEHVNFDGEKQMAVDRHQT